MLYLDNNMLYIYNYFALLSIIPRPFVTSWLKNYYNNVYITARDNMKAILCMILCVWGCLGFAPSLEAQEIKVVDGVEIIQNTKKPTPSQGTPTKLTLEWEAVIGESDDPDKAFSQLTSFVVDYKGTIYALDFKEQKIKVFDTDGQFIYAFGEQGQGPGELQMPAGIHLAPNNELAVDDALSKKMVYFTKEGKYLRENSYATRLALMNLQMDPSGNFIGREMKLEGQEMFFEVTKFDNDMNVLFTLDKIGFPVPLPGSGNKINMMDMISIYQFDRAGNIYYGRNRDYEIDMYTPQGELAKSIRKEYQPQKISEKDKEDMLSRLDTVQNMGPVNLREMFEFPKMVPPFQMFTLDEQGRIIVRTWEKGKEEGEFVHDVFDPEGRFISQFTSKITVSIWKKGKAYAIDENEDGFNVIIKYSVHWK